MDGDRAQAEARWAWNLPGTRADMRARSYHAGPGEVGV
jgi:hypothetical protein